MTMKKQICYSSQFKAMVILDLFQNNLKISQVAIKHKISEDSVSRWKKQLLRNASRVFTVTRNKEDKRDITNFRFHQCSCKDKNSLMNYKLYSETFNYFLQNLKNCS